MAENDVKSWVDTTIGDYYQVERKLGEGGMGEVYLARDRRLGGKVVLKAPRSGMLLDDPDLEKRFLCEVRAIAQLDHPHVVKVHNICKHEDRPVAVIQYLEGGTLEDRTDVPLERWLPQIAEALDYIHGKELVHRDVKPANILFDSHGNAYLSDFGVVKSTAAQTMMTTTGVSMGTPKYMSPEVIQAAPFDGRADQYALAIIVYEQLSGRMPFEATTPMHMFAAHLSHSPLPLCECDARFSRRLSDILSRGMAKEPSARFGGCVEFSSAVLETLDEGQASPVVPPRLATSDTPRSTTFVPRPPVSPALSATSRTKVQEPVEQEPQGPSPVLVYCRGTIDALGRAGSRLRKQARRIPPRLALAGAIGLSLLLTAIVGLFYLPDSGADSNSMISEAERRQQQTAVELEMPADFTNSIGMKFNWIPAGEFMMGSPKDEEDRDDEEQQHRVRITKPFYLSIYEVTQEQYERVMGENPSNFKGSTLPVEEVSWNDAVKFCRKLSALEGREYRLPTEAEWEYACRGGTTTPFSFGSVLNGEQGNCNGDEPYGTTTKGPYKGTTVLVGSYRPNNFGLYDMHGNVCEWCMDGYDEDYYGNSPVDDPVGPPARTNCVLRGGSYGAPARYCRSASRYKGEFWMPFLNRGFRPALVPVDVSNEKSPPSAVPDTSPTGPDSEADSSPSVAEEAPPPQETELEVPVDFTNNIGMKFKLIPAGEFMMGSPEREEDRGDAEQQHRVRITKTFYLGVYEVTQEQYEWVMGENPSNFKGSTLPVEEVSWNDAVEFCRKLSAKEDREYRLPTEAEWEYACRGGTTTPFSFGSELNGDQANCNGNYPYGTWTEGPYKKTTVPVGSYRANNFGLYDMHGNVWEWCKDWYDADYYANSLVDDPAGPLTGSARVRRGGSWLSRAGFCRSASRVRDSPVRRDYGLGFRPALVPADGSQ